MLINADGPVSPEVAATENAEALENKRIRALSNKALEAEIRHAMRTTGKTNHLTFCVGLGTLAIMKANLFTGNDPYRLNWSGRRPKMGRQRKGKVSATKVIS